MIQFNKHKYYLLFAITLPLAVLGVNPAKSPEAMEISKLWRPLTQTRNAASLGISEVKPHGVSEIGYTTESGNYQIGRASCRERV